MLKILFRVIIVYFFTVLSMKLMGKRQVGQMQMSELVTAFFLSELATYTVTNNNISIFQGLFPIIATIGIEVLISFLTVKIHLFKKIFDFAPSFLIYEGKILKKELLRCRLTIDELLSLLRLCGYHNIDSVRFALLEPNGQLSVIPFPQFANVSCKDIQLQGDDSGFSVAVIDSGKINTKALNVIGKSQSWLKKQIDKHKFASENEIFLMTSDFHGNTKIVRMDDQTNPMKN